MSSDLTVTHVLDCSPAPTPRGSPDGARGVRAGRGEVVRRVVANVLSCILPGSAVQAQQALAVRLDRSLPPLLERTGWLEVALVCHGYCPDALRSRNPGCAPPVSHIPRGRTLKSRKSRWSCTQFCTQSSEGSLQWGTSALAYPLLTSEFTPAPEWWPSG